MSGCFIRLPFPGAVGLFGHAVAHLVIVRGAPAVELAFVEKNDDLLIPLAQEGHRALLDTGEGRGDGTGGKGHRGGQNCGFSHCHLPVCDGFAPVMLRLEMQKCKYAEYLMYIRTPHVPGPGLSP
jgi:hypothetical protein